VAAKRLDIGYEMLHGMPFDLGNVLNRPTGTFQVLQVLSSEPGRLSTSSSFIVARLKSSETSGSSPLVPLQLRSSAAAHRRCLPLGVCLGILERALNRAIKGYPFSLVEIVESDMPAFRCSENEKPDVLVG
jgi:hypothetical protein